MKTVRIHLEDLKNEAWFMYLTIVIRLIDESETIKEWLTPLLTLLKKNYEDANRSLEIIRGSEFSKQLDDTDLLRDRQIGGLNNYVRAFMFDSNPDRQHAAERLMRVIDHYKAMAQAPQDEESALIINFVEELETNYTAEMEAIRLEDHKNQLKQSNQQFLDLQRSRTDELSARPARRMTDIRREGNRLIRMIYSQIDMLLLTAPSEDLTTFASKLNTENARVNGNLNRAGSEENKEQQP